MKKLVLSILVLVVLVGLLAGCSEENSNIAVDKVHAPGWSVPANVGGDDFHGTLVREEINAVGETNLSCRSCHGLALLGAGSAPSCTSCHSSIYGGHDDGWFDPIGGGQHTVVAIDDFSSCKLCHGEDYRGGIVLGCDTSGCHTGLDWPHPAFEVWVNPADPGFHGDSSAPCQDCHGIDFLGGSTGVGCFSCHFDANGARSPVADWIHGNTSADGDPHVELEVYGTVCNTCHTIERRFVGNPPACHDCHGGAATHVLGAEWVRITNHAQQYVVNNTGCLACHHVNDSTGIGVGCNSCHGSTAAIPTVAGDLGSCDSCHGSAGNAGTPSAGRPNGGAYPNRTGSHSSPGAHGVAACSECHFGKGTDQLDHWYAPPNEILPPSAPADVVMDPASGVTYSSGTCSGTCHVGGDPHDGETW